MRVLSALLFLLSQACASDAARAPDDDDKTIVPEGLAVTALPGGNSVLNVIALSLRKAAQSSVFVHAVGALSPSAAASAG